MNLIQFLEAIKSVIDPLTLIAFISVVLLAALITVLKYTGGLNRAMELLLRQGFQQGEIFKIVNSVLITLITISLMLFGFMAYQVYLNSK